MAASSPIFRVFRTFLRLSPSYGTHIERIGKILEKLQIKIVNHPTVNTNGEIFRISGQFIVKGVKRFCKLKIDVVQRNALVKCGPGVKYRANIR